MLCHPAGRVAAGRSSAGSHILQQLALTLHSLLLAFPCQQSLACRRSAIPSRLGSAGFLHMHTHTHNKSQPVLYLQVGTTLGLEIDESLVEDMLRLVADRVPGVGAGSGSWGRGTLTAADFRRIVDYFRVDQG
jgi:hypothetical protein